MTIASTIDSPAASTMPIGWSQILHFSVSFTTDGNDFNGNEFIQFNLDDPTIGSEPGICAIDPDITRNNNKVGVTLNSDDPKNVTAEVEVYVTGISKDYVKFEAALLAGDGTTPLANTTSPLKRIVGASTPPRTYFTAGTKIAFAQTDAKPSNDLKNYINVQYGPIDASTGKQFISDDSNAVEFVGQLCLKNSNGEIISGKEGLLGLKVYRDMKGDEEEKVNGDTLTVRTKNGIFDFFVVGGFDPLNGFLHLDIEGNTTESAGQLIVTNLQGANPRLIAPLLTGAATENLVDASTVGNIEGVINAPHSLFSPNSQIYVFSWNDDDNPKIMNLIDTKTWENAFQWYDNSQFNALTSNFTIPQDPGEVTNGIVNRIAYFYITTANVMQLSSNTMVRIWKSSPKTPPVRPPTSSTDLPAPVLPDADASFPNRVTPSMCKDGLRVTVGWADTTEASTMTAGAQVAVRISMSGWDSQSGTVKNSGGQAISRTITTAEATAKKATLQFSPLTTAGYRDDPATGNLGTIAVTWAIGGTDTFTDPTKVSASIIDQFYSHDVA